MTSFNPYALLAVAILIMANLVLGFIGGYEYATGREAKQAIKIEQKQENQHEADTITTQNEGQKYSSTVASSPVPGPKFRVCQSTRKAPAAPSPGPKTDATPSDRTFDEGVPPTGWPVLDTTPLLALGRNSDAQITGLQSYIRDVCRPK